VRFAGIRRGVLPPVLAGETGEVEPVWDERRGAPYVAAARIGIRARGGGEVRVREEVPLACLAGQIVDVLRVLVQAGTLVQGEVVHPKVCAHPVAPDAWATVSPGADAGIGIEEIPDPLALRETALEPFRQVAVAHGVDPTQDDVPVFVPTHVLAATEARARGSRDVETGGFLVGHLHRDSASAECFVAIVDQIPARHTIAERTRLTFTPATWAAAEADVRARGRGEEIVGWVHSHPFFCRACPAERRATCTLDGTFFSSEDVRLHALGFAQPYKTALLLSEREDGAIEHALFGWRRGVVVARGFHEIPDASTPVARRAGEEVSR
jgi:proteasome lid subunit RPN8/RPN11